jgi:hypothetical protein
MKRKYPEDTRDYKVINFCGKSIYHAYNILSEEDRVNILHEIEDELKCDDENDLKSTKAFVDATNNLSNRIIKNERCWYNMFNQIKKHLEEYAKITNDPKIKNIKIVQCWAKILRDNISEDDYHNELYIYYGNTHEHEHIDLGILYYIKNSSRIYGTLIEDDGHEIIIPGDQNSMIIHDPSVRHEAVLPHPGFLKDDIRAVLIVDLKYIY